MTGLEPANDGTTTHCLNQLGYTHLIVLTNILPIIILNCLDVFIIKGIKKWKQVQ